MKIATITCHHVYNYGATLQAYALQQYLISMGYDYEIINFTPWYHNRYSFWTVNRFSTHYNLIKRNILLKLIWCLKYNLPYLIKEYKRKFAFDKFDSKYLNITKRKYANIEDLRLDPPKADIYICGSDQIWNQDATFGIEKAYYLNFGNSDIYRMSYAASFGSDKFPSQGDKVRNLIKNIDKISVRERTGECILNKLGFSNIDIVLDPVFLLDRQQWRTLISYSKQVKTPEKYILLYNFRHNDAIKHFVLELQSCMDIPIICIHGYDDIPYADIKIKDAGPIEFLKLIESADIVVSDSFHATVFSIIFNREFYTFSLKGHNNTARMEDLLYCLGIKNRLNMEKPSKDIINYVDVNKRLNPLIENSKHFLQIRKEKSST